MYVLFILHIFNSFRYENNMWISIIKKEGRDRRLIIIKNKLVSSDMLTC